MTFGITFSTMPPDDPTAPHIIIPAWNSTNPNAMSAGPMVTLCNHTYTVKENSYEGSMTLAEYGMLLRATGCEAEEAQVRAALQNFWREHGTGDTYAIFSGKAVTTVEQAAPGMEDLMGALGKWNMSEAPVGRPESEW